MKIVLSNKDAATVARIIAEKAVEMHKKGAHWHRGDENLTCMDIGKMANKFLKPSGSKYDWDTFFSGKKKIKK